MEVMHFLETAFLLLNISEKQKLFVVMTSSDNVICLKCGLLGTYAMMHAAVSYVAQLCAMTYSLYITPSISLIKIEKENVLM